MFTGDISVQKAKSLDSNLQDIIICEGKKITRDELRVLKPIL